MKRFLNVFIIIQFGVLLFTSVNAQAPGDSLTLKGPSGTKGSGKGIKDSTIIFPDSLLGGGQPDSSKQIVIQKWKDKSDLDGPVEYRAKDSIVFDMANRKLFMFKEGGLNYDKISLDADSIAIDFEENVLHAAGKVDSTGQIAGRPKFKDENQDYSAEKIAFNYKSRKGKVSLARTKQGEQYVGGDAVKLAGQTKDGKEIIYIENGKFTSCDLEHPHYYIRSRKLKIIAGDRIISGPLQLVVEDFPIPFFLPFGFFPQQSGRRSGIILPTPGEQVDRGFFLKGLGYYWAVNDNIDLTFDGDIYTKGGYRIGVASKYNKRYRYSGNFSFDYSRRKFNEPIDPDYSVDNQIFLRWSHDQTISPATRLKANVNAGTSGFLSQNSFDQQEIVTNTLKSNITFSHKFYNSPFNLTVNLDHSQNNQTRNVSLGLPNLTLTQSRLFPFKKKGPKRKGFFSWVDQLGYSYTMRFTNQLSVPDTLLFDALFNPTDQVLLTTITDSDTTTETKSLRDYYSTGIRHTIPISTKITAFKYLNLSPSFNFNEYWYFREQNRTWDDPPGEVNTNFNNGFFTTRDFSMSMSASTQLYGFYQATRSKRKTVVRHTMNPNLSYTYKPDFSESQWGVYRTVQNDTAGNTLDYSRFAGGIVGGPSAGESQRINFGITNRLEMKRLKKGVTQDSLLSLGDDPKALEAAYVKSVLLENISVNSNYNFAADSLNLAAFTMNARTKLFNNKLSVQLDGTLDPYQVNDSTGRKINKFNWNKAGGGIGRITRLRFALSTSLRSTKGKNGKKGPAELVAGPPADPLFVPGLPQREMTDLMYFKSQYVDFSIPWTLSFNYNLTYSNSGIRQDTIQNVRIQGDLSLTPKWKVTYSSGYDITNNDFTLTQLGIRRDLHCWDMALSWIPFGDRRSFIFTLAVKDATLKDLKLTKRSDWQDRPIR